MSAYQTAFLLSETEFATLFICMSEQYPNSTVDSIERTVCELASLPNTKSFVAAMMDINIQKHAEDLLKKDTQRLTADDAYAASGVAFMVKLADYMKKSCTCESRT